MAKATTSTSSPEEVFREKLPKLSPLIGNEPNFTKVTDGLFGKNLIKPKELTNITSRHDLTDDMRGSQVTHLLYSKIEEKSGKSREEAVQCLLDICDVFESREVDSESLKEHGMSMRRAISNDASALSETPHVFQQMQAGLKATTDVNKDVASKVLSKNNEMIKDSIGLMPLADKMVENDIITDKEKSTIVSDRMSGLSKDERMEELLKELKKAVKRNGAIFMWFIKILKDYDTVISRAAAEDLMKQYTELLKTAA